MSEVETFYQPALQQVQQHVLAYFDAHPNGSYCYHNRVHTESVASATVEIANHYQLSDEDFFTVTAAAWFHDIGYFEDCTQHERRSAQMAADYLQTWGTDAAVIDKIKGCIMATQMPQRPVTLLEKIICDADLYHLGTADFLEKSKTMRREVEAVKSIKVSKHEWRQKTIALMEQHQYHTDYCRLLLDDTKAQNLKTLKEKEESWEEKNTPEIVQAAPVTAKAAAVPEKAMEKKKERPDKGIETMFRVSSGNHQRLSDMADNKAHIMITVNSIILSAILSLLLRRLEDHPYLIIPTVIILVISLLAMVFSILSTRPSIPDGMFTEKDVEDKKVNLLFFGNFYRMSLQDYAAGMNRVMSDREFLYGSLITDVYSQGVVLGKKYRLLRIAYNIFMYGLIASVAAFILATVLSGKH